MGDVICSRKLRRQCSPPLSIGDLPGCMLMEILIRLPLKSIFQCKCVSKQWCTRISAPSFAGFVNRFHASSNSILQRPFSLLFHYHNNEHNLKLLVASEVPVFKSLASSVNQYDNDNVDDTVIQASCHDLLLCTDNMQQVSYRVMRIAEFKGKSTKFKVDIFSSDTGKWSKSVVFCPQGFWLGIFTFVGVPYNGLLFWWSLNERLVGFDPYTSKCCRVFDKPIELEPSRVERLVVCHGALRICQLLGYPYNFANPKLRVWELKDYDKGGKWCLEHEVYFNQMVSKKSPWLTKYLTNRILYVVVLAYHPYDRDIVYVKIQNKVVSFNMKRKILEVVCDIPLTHLFYNGCNVFNFVLPCWPTPIPSSPSYNGKAV
nr:hypothetical protein CFP56_47992 [Quercus suber]